MRERSTCMAEDKIYRLLTLQQQLLSGNAIDKKAMPTKGRIAFRSIVYGTQGSLFLK